MKDETQTPKIDPAEETAYVAAETKKFMAALAARNLPSLVLVGLPSCGEFLRAFSGMESADNRRCFRNVATTTLSEIEIANNGGNSNS